jgi:hypothetical protein
MAVALLALFVSLGGVGYSATGGNFILGQANTATTSSTLSAPVAGKALDITNTNTSAAATALGLNVAAGKAPMTVNSTTNVRNLNADLLDGMNALSFIRRGVLITDTVSTAGGVVDVKNTGTTNGVQGLTTAGGASGVYGENTSGGGFGLAGRAGSSGHAIYGDNTGTGYAGYFEDKVHIGGSLDCSGCVGASDLSETYLKGSGSATGQALAVTPGANTFLGPPLNGFLRLSYFCPSPTTNTGFLWVYNDSGSIANVFIESGDANPTYHSMGAGANFFVPASPAGDSWHIQAQGAPGVQTIEVASVNRAGDCHAQAQGLLTG